MRHLPLFLTSSTTETVFRQSLILDWNPDVPGDDRSSFVRTTKSETLILSGMFGANAGLTNTEEKNGPKFHARALFPWEGESGKLPPSIVCKKVTEKRACSSESARSCLKSDLCLFRVHSTLRICARGGAPPLRAIVRPPREGTNSIVTWECLRYLEREKSARECPPPSPLFIPDSHFNANLRKGALSPWLCRMAHSETWMERNFNRRGDEPQPCGDQGYAE